MKFISLGRITKLGFVNFWRNGWLSFVNAIILAMTLLVITTFVIFNYVIVTTTQNVEEKINVSVYFNDEATIDEIQILRNALKKRTNIFYATTS